MIVTSILVTSLLSFLGIYLGIKNRNKIIEENINIQQLKVKASNDTIQCFQEIAVLRKENNMLKLQVKILTEQNTIILSQLIKKIDK